MKKLLIMGAMLLSSAAANAQNSDECTADQSPLIERVNVATESRPTETSAVVGIDLEAALPDGRQLTYTFHVASGSVSSDGPHATWNVEGNGPFTATVEVSASGYPCKSYANLTYVMENLNPDEE